MKNSCNSHFQNNHKFYFWKVRTQISSLQSLSETKKHINLIPYQRFSSLQRRKRKKKWLNQLETILSVSFTKPSPVQSLSDCRPFLTAFRWLIASCCLRTNSVWVVKYWRETLMQKKNQETIKFFIFCPRSLKDDILLWCRQLIPRPWEQLLKSYQSG